MIGTIVGVAVVATAVMTAAGLVLIGATPRPQLPVGFRLEEIGAFSVIQVAFGSAGALLALRRPRDPVGWLFLATAMLSGGLQVLSGYALHSIAHDRQGWELAAWVYNWMPVGFPTLVIPAIALFPDGRPTTRVGRALLVLVLPATAMSAAAIAWRPGPLLNMPSVRNPHALAADDPVLAILNVLIWPVFAVPSVLFVQDLVTRYRAASGVRRLQLKWLFWSGFLTLATILAASATAFLAAAGPHGGVLTFGTRLAFALSVSTLPIALGVAVLRYRLYEIDVLIRRTVVYGLVTGLLAAAYATSIVLLGAMARPALGGSEFAVAGSTLLTVALFHPVRRRAQEVVDRRFYRSRYDAAQTLEAFSALVRDEVDIEAVRSGVLDVVERTLRPTHAAVWLRVGSSRSPSASGPRSRWSV